jgi:hypothetical protein
MLRICHAPGCNEAVTGYSHYCDNHKKNARRHGAPQQQSVTVHELRPYAELVEARRAKNPGSEVWTILESRWARVLDRARVELQRYTEGQTVVRWERLAAHHMAAIGNEVEPWTVVRTALAMYLMQDQQPRRFITDVAFDFQLVRRVRGLAETNAGSYWDHKEQRSKRVYRDIPPRVTQSMAQPLKDAFGAAGLTLAAKEREDANKAGEERLRLASALEGLA